MKLLRLFSPLCLLLVLLLGGCSSKKADPIEATVEFFKNIAASNYQEAYESTAFAFKAQQSEPVFAQTLKELGLHEAAKAEMETPVIKGREAEINVTVRTITDKELKFQVTLLEESGRWRIFSLRSPNSRGGTRMENHFSLMGKGTAFNDALSRPMPDEAELRKLTNEAVRMFDSAVKQKSFEEFYEWASLAWQEQLTQDKLKRAFQPFITSGTDLSGAQNEKPIFDVPPAITTDGLLALEGHYPTKPNEIGFEMKFIYESPRWRIFGMSVNVRK